MSEVDVCVRDYQTSDEAEVLRLAPRLAEGVAPWRKRTAVLEAVHGWVSDSLAGADASDRAVFVAESDGEVAGFVSVSQSRHFSGALDAYVGELAVGRRWERKGVGAHLMARAERWASERGLEHLSLETGAANGTARSFYAALGYLEEDVRLTKRLG